MSEPFEPDVEDGAPRYLVGVRLREPLLADDYETADPDLHVGDLVMVETGGGAPAIGEVRRPKRVVPSFKCDRVYRRVVRPATARRPWRCSGVRSSWG